MAIIVAIAIMEAIIAEVKVVEAAAKTQQKILSVI
jgi:hypothetical protein